jgi:dipeptidyl aminopeptidase/acylaminoacyl peptidase
MVSLQTYALSRASSIGQFVSKGMQVAIGIVPLAIVSIVVLRAALECCGSKIWPAVTFVLLALFAALVHISFVVAGAGPTCVVLSVGPKEFPAAAFAPLAAGIVFVWNTLRPAGWRCAPLLILVTASMLPVQVAANDLAPRRKVLPDFAGETFRVATQLSPDGSRLLYLVMTATSTGLDRAALAMRPVTGDDEFIFASTHGRLPIQTPKWAYTNRHILYERPLEGAAGTGVYCLDIETGNVAGLSPAANATCRLVGLSPKYPDEVLLAVDDRRRGLADFFRVNLKSENTELVYRNPGYKDVFADDTFRPRVGVKLGSDGTSVVEAIVEDGKSRTLFSAAPALTPLSNRLALVGFSADESEAYFLTNYNRDTQGVTGCELATGRLRTIFESSEADTVDVLFDPLRSSVIAAAYVYHRRRWSAVDPDCERHLATLTSLMDGEMSVRTRSLDARRWLLAFETLDTSIHYYLYDSEEDVTRFLFSSGSTFSKLPLAEMHSVEIPTRDGLRLTGYLTLPEHGKSADTARPEEPLPLILLIHGGPYGRDVWGFHGEHQLFANRGYAVLSVNYRGSEGFGKQFLERADRQWGGKVLEDVVDAAEWTVRERIADRQRIALMGSSFGGYLTLLALVTHPDKFVCGIDRAGPCNLERFAEEMAQTSPEYAARRIADLTTSDGRKRLRDWSPLLRVERIQQPVLIFQGGREADRQKEEKKLLVRKLLERNIPATYVEFPQEEHSFLARNTRLAYYAVIEAFLKRHLNGQAEPIGVDVNQSIVGEILGAANVNGLEGISSQ